MYHFASPASPLDFSRFPVHILKVGALGTLNALGLAKAKGARLLLASTSEVYGDPQVHPQTESYWGNVNPIGERSMYDEAKRFAEALTMSYHRQNQVDTRIVRIFNTYGPRMRLRRRPRAANFVRSALHNEPVTVYGDGGQTRSFCYVDDLVARHQKLMESSFDEPVNIGNPEELTDRRFRQGDHRTSPFKEHARLQPLPKDDPHAPPPDITRTRPSWAGSPKSTRHEGLQEWTIEDFRKRMPGVAPV